MGANGLSLMRVIFKVNFEKLMPNSKKMNEMNTKSANLIGLSNWSLCSVNLLTLIIK